MAAMKQNINLDYTNFESSALSRLSDFIKKVDNIKVTAGEGSTFLLAPLPKGVYIVEISCGNDHSYSLCNISDLEVTEESNLLLCSKKVDNLYYSDGQKLINLTEESLLLPYGLIDLRNSSDKVGLYIIDSAGDIFIHLSRFNRDNTSDYKGYMWCNSATVSARQDLRFYASLQNKVKNRTPFLFELRNFEGKVLASVKQYSHNGEIEGYLKVPPVLAQRPHLLVWCDEHRRSISACTLGASPHKQSDFDIEATLSKTYYKAGEKVNIEISLSKKGGSPVTHTDVELNFSECQAVIDCVYGEGFRGMKAKGGFSPSSLLKKISIKTDGSGKAKATFICPPLLAKGESEQIKAVRIHAEVKNGLSAVQSVGTFFYVNNDRLYSLDGEEHLTLGDESRYFLQVNQFNGVVLAGEEFTLNIKDGDGNIDSVHKLKVGEVGQAEFTWKPKKVGNYLLCLEDKTKLRVEVVDRSKEPLIINLSDNICKVGDILSVDICTLNDELPVIFLVKGKGGARRFVLRTEDGRSQLNLKIEEVFGDYFDIEAYLLNSPKKVEKRVWLDNSLKHLSVRGELDSDLISNRDFQGELKTVNKQGRPVVSMASLSLIGPKRQPLLANDQWGDSVAIFTENKKINLGCYESDDSGSIKLDLQLPDLDGEWLLVANVRGKDGSWGERVFPLQIRSPFEFNHKSAEFINGGDVAQVNLQLKNITTEKLEAKVKIISADDEILYLQNKQDINSNIIEFDRVIIEPGKDHNFDLMVKGGLPGLSCIKVYVESGEFRKTYELPIEVKPLFISYIESESGILERESTLVLDDFKSEFIGRVYDRHLDIEIMNGLCGVLVSVTENLSHNENLEVVNVLSKWYSRTLCAELLAQKVTNEQEEEYLNYLKRAQNSDGGFSWKQGLKSDLIQTIFVKHYLEQLQNYGINGLSGITKRAEDYLVRSLDKLDISDRLLVYLVLDRDRFKVPLDKAITKADSLNNSGLLALIVHLVEQDRADEARVLWSKFERTRSKIWSKSGKVRCAYWVGDERFSDVAVTSLALLTAAKLGLEESVQNNYINWLMQNRVAGGWNTEIDTIFALEAISKRAFLDIDDIDKKINYGVWINGNEAEVGRVLDREISWHRHISFNVAQLPEGTLKVKFVKNGQKKIFVNVYEKLTLRGMNQSGYVNREHNEVIKDISKAPFYIESLWQDNGTYRGDKAKITLKVTNKRDLCRVYVKLPVSGGLIVDGIRGTDGLDYQFDGKSNCLEIVHLSPGKHTFTLDCHLAYCGSFSVSPAIMWTENGGEDIYAQSPVLEFSVLNKDLKDEKL
ncbi:hypothetical protein IJT10_06415 [bacterium]|nr:hypothetical protein [bacterium]